MLPTMITTPSLTGQNNSGNRKNDLSQTKKLQVPSLKKEAPDEDITTKETKHTLYQATRDKMDDELDLINPQNNANSDDKRATEYDTLATMNAIIEYNKKLMQRVIELENKQKVNDKIAKEHVQETAKDTDDEFKSKHDQTLPKNASFELPIGDILKSYGNFATEELPKNDQHESEGNEEEKSVLIEDEDEDEDEYEEKSHDDEDATVHESEEAKTSSGSISLGDGDRDDIVVKVEATKTGITFCIHIPRN